MIYKTITEGVFNSKLLYILFNYLANIGFKHKRENLIYFAFVLLKKILRCCPMYYLFEALEKIKPSICLKFYKQSYKKNKTKIKAIPYPLIISQQYKKSLYWFFKSIQKKTDKSFTLKIVYELYKINLYNLSDAILKKYEYYKYATLFKTSSRFKW